MDDELTETLFPEIVVQETYMHENDEPSLARYFNRFVNEFGDDDGIIAFDDPLDPEFRWLGFNRSVLESIHDENVPRIFSNLSKAKTLRELPLSARVTINGALTNESWLFLHERKDTVITHFHKKKS